MRIGRSAQVAQLFSLHQGGSQHGEPFVFAPCSHQVVTELEPRVHLARAESAVRRFRHGRVQIGQALAELAEPATRRTLLRASGDRG